MSKGIGGLLGLLIASELFAQTNDKGYEKDQNKSKDSDINKEVETSQKKVDDMSAYLRDFETSMMSAKTLKAEGRYAESFEVLQGFLDRNKKMSDYPEYGLMQTLLNIMKELLPVLEKDDEVEKNTKPSGSKDYNDDSEVHWVVYQGKLCRITKERPHSIYGCLLHLCDIDNNTIPSLIPYQKVIPAPIKSIETVLVAKAKELGYIPGVSLKSSKIGSNTPKFGIGTWCIQSGDQFKYDSEHDILYIDDVPIYTEGLWAKIVSSVVIDGSGSMSDKEETFEPGEEVVIVIDYAPHHIGGYKSKNGERVKFIRMADDFNSKDYPYIVALKDKSEGIMYYVYKIRKLTDEEKKDSIKSVQEETYEEFEPVMVVKASLDGETKFDNQIYIFMIDKPQISDLHANHKLYKPDCSTFGVQQIRKCTKDELEQYKKIGLVYRGTIGNPGIECSVQSGAITIDKEFYTADQLTKVFDVNVPMGATRVKPIITKIRLNGSEIYKDAIMQLIKRSELHKSVLSWYAKQKN